ncbi:MAG: hypothetical protein NVS2B16_33660 [Chloroflexota bacterium]
MGWEPADAAFYLNVVALCAACGGAGEVDATDEICEGCGGEGVSLEAFNPSNRERGLSLDQIGERLESQGLPFPAFVRADLEGDRSSNAATVLHEYDLEQV